MSPPTPPASRTPPATHAPPRPPTGRLVGTTRCVGPRSGRGRRGDCIDMTRRDRPPPSSAAAIDGNDANVAARSTTVDACPSDPFDDAAIDCSGNDTSATSPRTRSASDASNHARTRRTSTRADSRSTRPAATSARTAPMRPTRSRTAAISMSTTMESGCHRVARTHGGRRTTGRRDQSWSAMTASRSSRLRILPDAFRGSCSVTIVTLVGTLKFARRSPTKRCRSPTSRVWPGLTIT